MSCNTKPNFLVTRTNQGTGFYVLVNSPQAARQTAPRTVPFKPLVVIVVVVVVVVVEALQGKEEERVASDVRAPTVQIEHEQRTVLLSP